MAAQFPTSLPGLPANYSSSTQVASTIENQQELEINALAAKVGVDSSAVTTSHDYKLQRVTGSDKAAAYTDVTAAAAVAAAALAAHEADTSTHGVAQVAGIADIQTHNALTNVHGVGQVVGVSEPQTLTNKTLTAPQVDNPSIDVGSDADYDRYYRGTDGVLKRLEQSAFSVYQSTDTTLSAANTDTIVQFDTETFDFGSDFNVATYKYTAPVTGIYTFGVHAYLYNNLVAGSFELGFRKNGTTTIKRRRVRITASQNELTCDLTTQCRLSEGDTIEFIAQQSMGTTQKLFATSEHTQAWGRLEMASS